MDAEATPAQKLVKCEANYMEHSRQANILFRGIAQNMISNGGIARYIISNQKKEGDSECH